MKARTLVARNIRKVRVRRGVSQENLAVDAGIDRTYVSRLERELENPTIAVLELIALALGTEIGALFMPMSAREPPPKPLRGSRKRRRT